METKEGKFSAKDGFSIFWKAFFPDGKPKAVVHIIHGYAEHIDRYKNVIDEIVPAGYAVIGNDHRGHGRSDGKRGHVNSFQEYINDERQFSQDVVKPLFPDIPYFMLGHSMGSLIAINYVEQYPEGMQALILSGTGSRPGPGINKIMIIALKILSRLLPSIHVKSPLPPEFISRDPEVVKAYVDDPYVYNVLTPRLGEQMNTYIVIGAQNAGKIKLPVLIQRGSEDTSFSGQKDLFDAIGSQDKTFKVYQGLRHEVYNELPQDRKIVLADLHAWLDKHI